jgi:integrase
MRTDYLNPDLYNRLYSVMTYENVLALRVSLETGLRIDDVLSLTPDMVKGQKITGTAEKTGKKYRKTISKDLNKRLLTVKGRFYVFPHRLDERKHRTRQAVWKNMKKAARLLGVELNAAPHSARKTYAVEVFRDRGIEAAKSELQHDRISTTMLYAFADLLTVGQKCPTPKTKDIDLDTFADLIAEKVVQKLKKPP